MYVSGNMGLVFFFLFESNAHIVNLTNLLCHISCHTWKENTRLTILLLNLARRKC